MIAQRLFIPLAGLPSPLITQIKRLAAFQNPEFYQKQRLRLSTHDTPRIISGAEELPGHLSLPRGCVEDLRALLESYGVALVIEDRCTEGVEAGVTFTGTLSPEQARAVEILAATDIGVLVAPPGSGKTVIAIALLARRGRNALVLVHRKPLVDQWVSRLAVFTGIRRSPLVLTERRDHLEYLANRLRPFTRNLVIMHGGAGAKVRREVMRRLAEILPDEERLVLATGRYIGEGFDDARLDTLFLAMPFGAGL